MPFMSAISAGQKTTMRDGGHANLQYLLICPNTIVFKAQVNNQPTTAPSYMSVGFDNVTVGAYTDIKEGYTVAISSFEDFRDVPQSNIFRVRADNSGVVSTASTININQTSVLIADNMYIMVVKDVREVDKQALIDDSTSPSTYYKDGQIEFRRLLPLCYGQPSVAVVRLVSGAVDYLPTVSALITDNDASSISTWAWDSDSLPYKAGSASTDQNPTFRPTAAGHYMPRVTFTDDAGVANWFTFHLFVVPENYSSVVNLSFDGVQRSATYKDGWSASINAVIESATDARYQIDSMADYTLCAVWQPGTKTAVNSEIKFVGRFRAETIGNDVDAVSGRIHSTSFQLEGLTAIMGRINTQTLALRRASTPARFDEIEDLTPYRGIAYYLTEHTTIPNTHSITFDAFDETFLFPRLGIGDSSVLENVQMLAWQITAGLEFAPTGEMKIARMTDYLSSTAREALTTVMDFTMTDNVVNGTSGRLFSIQRDYVSNVGRMTGYGAYQLAAGSDDTQTLRSIAPAVIAQEGDDQQTLNSQILTAAATLSSAYGELGTRNANHLRANQPRDILDTTHDNGYDWLIPTRSAWCTHTIPATENNRGIAYTTQNRWTLESVSIAYDINLGDTAVQAKWILETTGTDYQVNTSTPIGTTPVNNPVVPVVPAYPNYPPDPSTLLPDPNNIADGDLPPFNEDDVNPVVNPSNPGSGQGGAINNPSGNAGVLWNASNVYKVINVPTVPGYLNFTPQNLEGYAITDVKPDKFSNKLWVLGNDSTNTRVFKTNSFGDLQYTKTDIANEVYTMLRLTDTPDELYLYTPADDSVWHHTFQFDTASGSDPDTTYGDSWGVTYGSYSAGVGYIHGTLTTNADYTLVLIGLGTDDFYCTYFRVTYDLTVCSGSTASRPKVITISLDSTEVEQKSQSPTTTGNDQTYDLTPAGAPTLIDEMAVQLYCCTRAIGGGFGGSIAIKQVYVEGVGTNPFAATTKALTRRSTNAGATFASAIIVGNSPSTGVGAMDTLKVGNSVFAANDDGVQVATDGGAYSAEPDGTPTTGEITCIHAYGEGADNYVFAQSALSSNEAVYDVNGGNRTDITPDDGSNHGLPVGPDCIHGNPADEDSLFAVMSFSGNRKVCASSDRGANWAFNANIDNNANWIRAKNGSQIVVVASAHWYYSGDTGTTLYERTAPISSLVGFEFL